MSCFAVAAVYGGEQNGFNQIYYFRIFNAEIIYYAAFVSSSAKERLAVNVSRDSSDSV